MIQVDVADAPCRTRASPERRGGRGRVRARAASTRHTWLQVAELGQRAHLQVLEGKGLCFPARQVPRQLLVDHTHTTQLHQGPEQQRDLDRADRWGEGDGGRWGWGVARYSQAVFGRRAVGFSPLILSGGTPPGSAGKAVT